jgi:two-component system sensor histidine kinase UhpB
MGDIVWSIRSEPHGWESLIRHMREFALDVLASQGIDFQLRTPPSLDGVPMSLQMRRQLFLMFKESIHNVVRHARCRAVVAHLQAGHREVVLTVEDDGIGWSQGEQTPGRAGGTGIPGMQRRAESLGGRMRVIATPGQGCRVEIHLPVRRSRLVAAASS